MTLSNSVVRRLKVLFVHGYDHADDVHYAGYMHRTGTPCVLKLIGDLLYFVYDHFRVHRQDGASIEISVRRHKLCYGIIDGGNCNAAVRELMTEREDWKDFKWFLMEIKGGNYFEKY